MEKISIYQVFTRLFGNTNSTGKIHGSSSENGVGKMSHFTTKALYEIKKLGITHIWYTGIIEHARCEGNSDIGIAAGNPKIIKGRAGSPYAITDYYDINPDIAEKPENRMQEFEQLVERTHNAGMKVIIDFVPNHVAREYKSDIFPERNFGINDDVTKSFSPKNDFYYIPGHNLVLPDNIGTILTNDGFVEYNEFPAKATGNDQFSAYPEKNDWYETVKLNYGVDYSNGNYGHFSLTPPLWNKMVDILLYWASKNIDGFRCDMVEMVPVEFWEYAIAKVKKQYPDVKFYAEVYNPNLYNSYIYKGGFDYMYDKVGLYDSIKAITCYGSPVSLITNCWQSLHGIDKHMLRFLENHDEQRFASRFFTGDVHLTLPAMLVSALLHQGPVMTYFGQEVGEPALGETGYSGDDGRTTIFDYFHVPEHIKWVNNHKFDGGDLSSEQKELRNIYKQILNYSISNEAIAKGDFYDLMWCNSFENPGAKHFVYAFMRYSVTQRVLVVTNFDRHNNYPIILKIPDNALELMGLSENEQIVLKSALFDANEIIVSYEELKNRGIWLNIRNASGLVFSIE